MRILHRLIPFLFAFLSAHAANGQTQIPLIVDSFSTEVAERQSIFDSVKSAVAAHDYAALNRMEYEFRTQRSRTSSGTWKLASFHTAAVSYVFQPKVDEKCDYLNRTFLKDWAAVDPNAPSAYIVEADLLRRQAWCHRGAGFARDVPREAWVPFHANIEAAFHFLIKHKNIAQLDPQYFAVMEQIYIAQGREKGEFKRLLLEATEREPYYYDLYFSAYQYYRPQWFGSYDEIDALARFAAEKTKVQDGKGAYARLYWFVTECNCALDQTAVDHNLLKVAMQDVVDRYPTTWNAAHFANISCSLGEIGKAAHFLSMVKEDAAQAWAEMVEWDACKLATNGYRSAVVAGQIRE